MLAMEVASEVICINVLRRTRTYVGRDPCYGIFHLGFVLWVVQARPAVFTSSVSMKQSRDKPVLGINETERDSGKGS